jgi:hypothetical protein
VVHSAGVAGLIISASRGGGVFALFGVRIAIAIVAEISAIALFGELRNYRLRLRILSWVRKNRRGSV